ncbi:MAG: prepilin-type cleavage/methylation domain-containing protein, partial [Verrucomicrobiota bacterium]
QYEDATSAAQFGFVDLRYNGKAVVACLDGHTETLNEEQIQDMRRWSPLAAAEDDPDWTL